MGGGGSAAKIDSETGLKSRICQKDGSEDEPKICSESVQKWSQNRPKKCHFRGPGGFREGPGGSWVILGGPGRVLGGVLGRLGGVLDRPGGVLGHPGGVWGVLGAPWGRLGGLSKRLRASSGWDVDVTQGVSRFESMSEGRNGSQTGPSWGPGGFENWYFV